jgi:hypothetical protein
MNKIFLGCVLLMSTACASLQSVSFTEMPAQRNHQVSAEVSKFMFLFLSFDNDFVNSLPQELEAECRGGSVEGIMTKHESYSYILFHRIVVKARGYCVKSGKA